MRLKSFFPSLITVPIVLIALNSLFAEPSEASTHRTPRKSPHAEIVATARVETVPVRKVHKNGRDFEEFDIAINAVSKTLKSDRNGDPDLNLDQLGRIHVVHDLSCGGSWVELAIGDRVELKGEYVHPPGQHDLIHFTHPAGGACGRKGSHPDGYLRKAIHSYPD